MPYELKRDLEHVLERTRPIWAELSKANVFIAGGTGFVGLWLLESFAWAKRRLSLETKVFVLSRNPEGLLARAPHFAQQPGLEVLQGDIRTFRFPAEPMHFVIHAAMEHETSGQPDGSALAANTAGTERVLEMARACGTQRLLYVSSGAVYDLQPPEMGHIDEEFSTTGTAASGYARAKRESELLCLDALSAELAVVIARLFTFAGPYLPLDLNFAAGNFVRDALVGGPIRVEGDGSPVRSYLYAADMAIWLWTLLVQGVPGRAYNVGSEDAVNILQLARIVEKVCGVDTGVAVARWPSDEDNPNRYLPSVMRARTELGLRPWVGLEDGIERMFAWHRQKIADDSLVS